MADAAGSSIPGVDFGPAGDWTQQANPEGGALAPPVRAFLSGVAGGSNVTPMPANGGSIRDRVRQEWLSAGYSPPAVDGILRRVQAESKFDPQSIGDGGTSFGLYQHHDTRAVGLQKWAERQGLDPGDPIVQTKYAIAEMNGLDPIAAKSRDALMRATDPQAAYGLFTSSFERPAGAAGSEETNLRRTAGGAFNPAAQGLLSQWQEDIQRRGREYDSALAEAKDLRTASRAAMEKWYAESEKPPSNMHEAWQSWIGPASVLAGLGGFFGRNHAGAINAAGEMLQAANAADSKSYDAAYAKWKDHLSAGLKLTDLLHTEARDIVEDARKSYDRKVTELSTLSAVYSLQQKLDPNSVENLTKNLELLKHRSDLIKAQNQDSDTRAAVAEKDAEWLKNHPEVGKVPAGVHLEHEGEAKRTAAGTSFKPGQPHQVEVLGPDGSVVRRGAAYSVAGGGMVWVGGGDVEVPQGGTVNLKSTQQPRSASGLAVARFLEENPNAGSADIAQFNAEYTRLAALDRDFASGPDARNLISLNTVADHIPLFRRYAQALNTGNTQVANAVLQEIQRQTGHSDITNFDLAKEFLADEVARVLVPGGAGALADREAMKARLKASMSQEQLAGGADTSTAFIKGKLEALRQQYGRGDEKREKYFNERMLTHGARDLFGQSPASGKHYVGEVIEHGGKRYRVTGGDMSDPDVEEVK